MRTCHHPFLVLAVIAAFIVSACAVTAQDREAHPRITSYTISQAEETALGAALADDVKRHPGQSGFRLLENARESLSMRLALVEAAEKTLDLQYYIVHDDDASNLMLEAIMRAAERGVRVRFLIDGITFSEVDDSLAILNNVSNIEIRVFNPMVKPAIPLMAKLRIGILDLANFTKRMHNKSLIADNQLAVTGGRNLGDEYFDENPDNNFKDMDVLSAGPVTNWVSKSFDRYWNDENAWLIADLHPKSPDPMYLEDLRKKMQKSWAEKMDATGATMKVERLAERLKNGEYKLNWAPGTLSVDPPEKIDQDAVTAESKPIEHLSELAQMSQKELMIITPYFVPGEGGVQWFADQVQRGVRVRVITNALASTDVVAVHAGYKKYREDLIKAGVELYEFKPLGDKRPEQRVFGSKAPTASLHSKAAIIDRSIAMVGSYNLDPRSVDLNTELALIIQSPAIAGQLADHFEKISAPEQSYRVQFQDGDLIWVTMEDGQEKVYETEPGAGVGRKLQSFFVGLLPLENQL